MAIGAPTSIGSNKAFASAGTIALTCSASVAAGQFVVVFIGSDTAGTTVTVADSKGNTYAVDVTANTTQASMAAVASAQITTPLTTSDTITATYSVARTDRVIAACQVSGIATSAALDKTAGTNGSTLAFDSGNTATTTVADELVIGCSVDNASAGAANPTATPSAGFTELHDGLGNADGVGLESLYKIVSATGTYNVAGSWDAGTSHWQAVVATYKADAAAAAVIPDVVMAELR